MKTQPPLMPRKAAIAPVLTEPRRCVIYTRKSTTAGLDMAFTSLDAQRDACISYIQRQPDWVLSDERYDDGGFTGANTERPAFQRLLADVDAGRIDIVVVYKVDRLSRSLFDFVLVIKRFQQAGTGFVSVTQNFSTADAMGRLTMNMLLSFAEFERDMISERTRDKIAASRRRGQWTGGMTPLGYTLVNKKLELDELEAIVAREVFALYLEHRAVLAVVRTLKSRGRRTKRGRPWTKNDVLRVLKNPIYAGYIASGDELHEGAHSSIVERVVFARAQALLQTATRDKKAAGRNPDYILRSVLFCACCGSAFTPASTTKRGTTHRYYRCVKRDKEGKEACRSSPLPAPAIEAHVIARIREVTADGTLAIEVSAAVERRIQARKRDIVVEREQVPPRIAALAQEARRLVDALADVQGPARRPIEARLQEVEDERARCEVRLVAAERELVALEGVAVETFWVARCLADFDKVWDALTVENRGRLVCAVVQRVDINEPAGTVTVRIADLGAGIPEPAALPGAVQEAATP